MPQPSEAGPISGFRANAGGTALLLLVVSCSFVVPVFPAGWHPLIYGALYSGILVMAALALDRRGPAFLVLALVLVVMEMLSVGTEYPTFDAVSQMLNVSFFLYVVVRLVAQIAGTRSVEPRSILAAINGYLMLGLAASIAITMVTSWNPDAISFPELPAGSTAGATSRLSDQVYFGFVTLTTMGYGDVTPKSAVARSLSTLIGVVGQLYVAIVIATLVGKWASRPVANDEFE